MRHRKDDDLDPFAGDLEDQESIDRATQRALDTVHEEEEKD